MSHLVVIPSARIVAPAMQAEFGPVAPAMIPLAGRPALEWIADAYPQADICVAIHQAGQDVAAYLRRQREPRAHAVDVGATDSIAETILRAAGDGAGYDRLTVHFADTLLDDTPAADDVIFWAQPIDLLRWTSFADYDGSIGTMIERDQPKTADGVEAVEQKAQEQKAFVGVFQFADPQAFLADLAQAAEMPGAGIDPFFLALKRYFNGRPPKARVLQYATCWRDLGHVDNYYTAKRRVGLGPREFNAVDVDDRRGVMVKSSRNAKKLRNEIRWYQDLPQDLQFLAPRVFRANLSHDMPSVEMEFYGYPPLNDLFLFGRLDVGAWTRIFDAVGFALEAMRTHSRPGEEQDRMTAARREIYLDKTLERLEPIVRDQRFAAMCEGTPKVNGQAVPSLPQICEELPEIVEVAGLLSGPNFCVIHGDCCASNILYDPKNAFVRFIDPRGQFGSYSLSGDPRYDLAKLSHSFSGGYDFIVNGLFDVRLQGQEITLEVFAERHHQDISDTFVGWLDGQAGADMGRIQLIEALLFLSMTPLHADKPRSQLGFLANGLRLYAAAKAELGLTGRGQTAGKVSERDAPVSLKAEHRSIAV